MSDRTALLRSIIENPAEDTPRLIFADYLEEHGEAERAEFVRVQCELARVPMNTWQNAEPTSGMCWGCWIKALGKEADFENSVRQFGCKCSGRVTELRRRERELLDEHGAFWGVDVPCAVLPQNGHCEWSRGFISTWKGSWDLWLKCSPKLYWRSGETMECPKCGSLCRHLEQHYADNMARRKWEQAPCLECNNRRRIPRPCPATAMPIETVRLTDWPPMRDFTSQRPAQTFYTQHDGFRFDREKCPTCDGDGFDPASTRLRNPTPLVQQCPACYGQPLNSWACERWRGVRFVLPERQVWIDEAAGMDWTGIAVFDAERGAIR